jgi:hypothetical protein
LSAPEPEPEPLPSPSPPEPPSFPPPEPESGSPTDEPPVFAGEAEVLAPVAAGASVADAPESVPAVPCELEAEPVTEAVPPLDPCVPVPLTVPVLSAAAVPVAVAVACPDEAPDVRVAVEAPVPDPADDAVAVVPPLELSPPFAAVEAWNALAALNSSLARLAGVGGSGFAIPCGSEYTVVHCVKERRNMS